MTAITDSYKANAIIMGEQREKYDEWFQGASKMLKQTFAELGYYPDELIHDDDIYIGLAVIEYSLHNCAKYARHLLKRQLKQEEFTKVLRLCLYTPQTDAETLQLILDNKYGLGSVNLRAIHTKLEGLTTNPSILEQTMDRYQLYELDNPQWARNISIDAIANVHYIKDRYILNGQIQPVPEGLFNEVIGERLTGVTFSRCVELLDEYMNKAFMIDRSNQI